jgi:hypothetical protein
MWVAEAGDPLPPADQLIGLLSILFSTEGRFPIPEPADNGFEPLSPCLPDVIAFGDSAKDRIGE